MELVYVHRDDKGEPDGKKYGGIDVGIGGERYTVIEEGTRQLIRGVPNHVDGRGAHEHLEPHGWVPTGILDADIVEIAAQRALRQQASAVVAQREADRADAEAKDAAAALEQAKKTKREMDAKNEKGDGKK